jgi:cysteine synthase
MATRSVTRTAPATGVPSSTAGVVGRTPMQLTRLGADQAALFGKIEARNPGGSNKD